MGNGSLHGNARQGPRIAPAERAPPGRHASSGGLRRDVCYDNDEERIVSTTMRSDAPTTVQADYDRKLDALQRELTAMRRAGGVRREAATRRARLLAALAVALLVALVPMSLFAAAPFN